MSIYREEAIDALIEALRKRDFPASQVMALEALSSLPGHLNDSGKSCIEAWLLKVAGFDQPYNALAKEEKPKTYRRDLAETIVCNYIPNHFMDFSKVFYFFMHTKHTCIQQCFN